MTLRCKVGDLAIQIKSLAGNEGATVEILQFAGLEKFYRAGEMPNCWRVRYPRPSKEWFPDGRVAISPAGAVCFVPDAWLLPIRPDLNEPSLELELQLDKLIKLGKKLTVAAAFWSES